MLETVPGEVSRCEVFLGVLASPGQAAGARTGGASAGHLARPGAGCRHGILPPLSDKEREIIRVLAALRADEFGTTPAGTAYPANHLFDSGPGSRHFTRASVVLGQPPFSQPSLAKR